MTKAIKASEVGLEPHFKVRVVLPGALLHLASRTEPELVWDDLAQLRYVLAEWIGGDGYGDTPGMIKWREVTAVTWRWSP